MIESRIARRYLWAARKQAHTAFLSVISILGLAVGVAALLFSIALLSGLQGQIKERLIQASPQILIEPAGKNTLDDAEQIVAAAKAQGLRNVQPYVSGIAWGGNEERGNGRPLRLRSHPAGQEPESASHTRRDPVALEPGESPILMTRAAAAGLGLDHGETVMVVAPRTRLTPFGPVPIVRRYRITRLVAGVSEENATDAWLEESEASNLFGTGGKPTAIEGWGPAELAEPVQAALAPRFPQAQFKTWKEINRPLVLALRLEKIVMFATISLVILVAALNLVSSLSMLIMEKRPSVGVLRTIGATDRTILSVFLQVGLLIGLTGTILGNVVGIGAAWLANRYKLVPLPSDIYFVSYLPFRLDVQDVVVVNVITVFLAVIATWYPARVASRLDPIASIRSE